MRVRAVAELSKRLSVLKDLPKNSSNRFEKINTRMNFQKKYALPCLLGVFLLPVWLFSRFKRLPLSRVSTYYSHIELGQPVAHVALLRISPDRDLDSLLHSRF